MNPMKMLQGAVVVGVIILMIASKLLWDSNQDLKEDNLIMQTQIKTTETNIKLLTELLNDERETREAAMTALTELRKDVPDVVYREKLSPSIQGVLDRFHDRIRNTK